MNFLKLSSTDLKGLSIVAAPEQIASELGGEVVVLNLKTGTYHGLDTIGARIWSLLQEPRTIDAILENLLNEYDVDRDRCQCDLLKLLQDLANADLIEVKHEAVA
jgi:hypothetical protein